MRKFLTFVGGAAVLAAPGLAQARGLDTDFSQTVTGPFKIEVVVSDDLAHRANNLPENLSDRATSSRLNSGFANNGEYGEREIEYLIEELRDDLTRDFDKRGLILSETAPTLLRVTIEEVKPNRPTFNQLGEEPGLSFSSFSIGGADVSAEFIDAGGTVIGTADYSYFSNFNERAGFLQSTNVWSDTDRAFSRFSRRLSKKLAKMNDNGS